MFGFGGLSEVVFILFLAMLIFGPEKLPEIGRMLAKGMAEVRKASNELKRTLNAELAISEQEKEARRLQGTAPFPPSPAAPPPAPAWSAGQTVPNLDVPGAYAAAPSADVAPASADVAPADLREATAADLGEATDAALTSEAAYLAAWPEDGASPAAAVSAVPVTPATSASTSTSASPAPAAAADSAAPAAPAAPAPPAEAAVAAAPADAAAPGAPAAAPAPAAPAAPAVLAPALVETHGAGTGSGRDSA